VNGPLPDDQYVPWWEWRKGKRPPGWTDRDEAKSSPRPPEKLSATYRENTLAETKVVSEPTPSSEGGELPFAPLAPMLNDVPAEPDWLVRGYLATFAVTLLAGRPKVGKSTLACWMLASLQRAALFAGLETAAGGTLLLTEERRDTLAEKARASGLVSFRHDESLTAETKRNAVHALMRHDAGNTAWPEIVRQAMAYCHRHELAVLVVDTFDRWTGVARRGRERGRCRQRGAGAAGLRGRKRARCAARLAPAQVGRRVR